MDYPNIFDGLSPEDAEVVAMDYLLYGQAFVRRDHNGAVRIPPEEWPEGSPKPIVR